MCYTVEVNKVVKSENFFSGSEYEGLPRVLVKEPSFAGWTFNNENANREIDYAKHLKRSYFDQKNR